MAERVLDIDALPRLRGSRRFSTGIAISSFWYPTVRSK